MAAELPEAVATEYAEALVSNAIDLDQASELNRAVCQQLGFKVGHALKLLAFLGSPASPSASAARKK